MLPCGGFMLMFEFFCGDQGWACVNAGTLSTGKCHAGFLEHLPLCVAQLFRAPMGWF